MIAVIVREQETGVRGSSVEFGRSAESHSFALNLAPSPWEDSTTVIKLREYTVQQGQVLISHGK